MADFYTNQQEENLIDRVRKEGFGYKQPEFSEGDFPKYLVLRVALARALRGEKIPLDSPLWEQRQIVGEKNSKRSEYHLAQLTGKGSKDRREDIDTAVRALLYVRHKDELGGKSGDKFGEDFFASDEAYLEILGKYIRRGLFELQDSWKNNDSIYQWGIDNLELNDGGQSGSGSSGETINGGQISEFVRESFGQLERFFKNFGISVSLRGQADSYRNHIFQIILDSAHNYDNFYKKLPFLSNELGRPVLVQSCEGVSRGYAVQIPKPASQWDAVGAREFGVGLAELQRAGFKLGVYAGQTLEKQPFCFDLAKAPHLFVAGTTGSGKSVLLKNLILCLCKNKNAKIYILDQKEGLDFNVFGDKASLITDAKAIKNTLESLCDEMNARYRTASEAGCDDIARLGLPYIVVVIDELKDLLDQEGKGKEVSYSLTRLAQKARQIGIHLVLATQRPDAKSFSGILRSNVPSRIALKVQKHTESKIILDDTGAEMLLGSGDMLIRLVNMPQPKRVLGAYLSDDEIRGLL